MRAFLLIVALSLATPCLAQSPHWEVFGGYSMQHSTVREYYKSTPIIYSIRNLDESLTGWTVSFTENLSRKRIGGTLEVSGHYKSPVLLTVTTRQRIHSIMYGPRVSILKNGPIRPFAHVLVGLAHAEAAIKPTGAHGSDYAIAEALGGGVDIRIGKKVAVRALQAEYFRANLLGTKPHSYRASTGIVFYLGK